MEFITVFGDVVRVDCLGCVDRTLPSVSKFLIHETDHFIVEQDLELAYPALVVLVPKRHISNYEEMTQEEILELSNLIVKSKKIIQSIFDVDRFAYMFYERPNGHFHFIIIPLLPDMKIKEKSGVLAEIIQRNDELKRDVSNMTLVSETIKYLRVLFKNI